MGQGHSYQQKPIHQLIKDVAQFNLLAKTAHISQELNVVIHAIVKKATSGSFTDSIMMKQHQNVIQLDIHPENKVVQIQEPDFYMLKSLIESLASVTLEKKEEGMCEICFEKQIDKLLPCGHSYCENCVVGWFIEKNQESCPMCRAQLSKQRMQSDSYCVPSDMELIVSLKEQILSFLK